MNYFWRDASSRVQQWSDALVLLQRVQTLTGGACWAIPYHSCVPYRIGHGWEREESHNENREHLQDSLTLK